MNFRTEPVKDRDSFRPGEEVVYIPPHANNDMFHKDCEFGVVTSIGRINTVFVKFYQGRHAQAADFTSKSCKKENLILKSKYERRISLKQKHGLLG